MEKGRESLWVLVALIAMVIVVGAFSVHQERRAAAFRETKWHECVEKVLASGNPADEAFETCNAKWGSEWGTR
jgi:hypothetical protein